MIIRRKKDTWLTYLTELISGVVHAYLYEVEHKLKALWAFKEKQERINNMRTKNEERLLKVAQSMTTSTEQIREGLSGMRARLEQAISDPKVKEMPEDLSQELEALENAADSLNQTASQFQTSVGGNQDSANSGPIDLSPADAPTSPAKFPSTGSHDTPLAGESGPSNIPTDAEDNPIEIQQGQVYADQGQAGIPAEPTSNLNPNVGDPEAGTVEQQPSANEQIRAEGEAPTGTPQGEPGTESNKEGTILSDASEGGGTGDDSGSEGDGTILSDATGAPTSGGVTLGNESQGTSTTRTSEDEGF